VAWLHANAPYRSKTDLHHRVGVDAWEAAAGNHRHRGTDSAPLFSSTDVITGDLSTTLGVRNALKQVIGLLVQLGATDNTTG
jgi:hypothetical protein